MANKFTNNLPAANVCTNERAGAGRRYQRDPRQDQPTKSSPKQLDGGQIGVSDFLQAGQPLAAKVNQELFWLCGTRQQQRYPGTKMLQDFQSNTGFKQSGDGNQSVAADLPAQYQQKLREELLPANLSPDERKPS
jgi:hypothetical protein